MGFVFKCQRCDYAFREDEADYSHYMETCPECGEPGPEMIDIQDDESWK